MTSIQISKLSFAYPGRTLFNNLSLHLTSGLIWVQGDEGCGKTTLLRLLSGTLAASSGELEINGANLRERAQEYGRLVYWVNARSEAFDQLSPTEYFDSVSPQYTNFSQSLLEGLITTLDLTPHLHKKMFMLSTGSKRKVWLAAAFASGASLTLIDDPFAALDQPSVRVIRELFEEASEHASRAFVVADYEVPEGLSPTQIIKLSPPPA